MSILPKLLGSSEHVVIASDPLLLGACVVAAGQAVAFAAVFSFGAWNFGLGSLCLCFAALSRVLLSLLLLETKPLLVHAISEAARYLILQVSTSASVDLISILLYHHVEVLELFFFSLPFVLVQVHLALLQGVALSLELLV